jgi:HSP20 family protein
MTLLRFDPFRELDRWTEQAWPSRSWRHEALAFDAVRRGHEVVLQFDVPGADPESFEVTVEKGVLTVAGERRSERREGDEVLVARRPAGRFHRQILLGDNLDIDQVKAEYDAGVLTVTLPVADHVQPRKIEVHTGRQAVTAESAPATDGAESPAA